MHLTLDPADLKPEFQEITDNGVDQAINTRDVTFEKLSDEAQAAVRAVGQGTFYAWDRRQAYIVIISLEIVEKDKIVIALRETNGNREEAARTLGIPLAEFQGKLRVALQKELT